MPLSIPEWGIIRKMLGAKWASFENRLLEFPRLLANNPQYFVRVEKPEFLPYSVWNIYSKVFVTWQGVPGQDDLCSWQGSTAMNSVTLRDQEPPGVSACLSVG
jgi:hypothetical protein